MTFDPQMVATLLGSNLLTTLATAYVAVRKTRNLQDVQQAKFLNDRSKQLHAETQSLITDLKADSEQLREELGEVKNELRESQERHEKCTEDNRQLRQVVDRQGWAMLKLIVKFGLSPEDPEFKFLTDNATAEVSKKP